MKPRTISKRQIMANLREMRARERSRIKVAHSMPPLGPPIASEQWAPQDADRFGPSDIPSASHLGGVVVFHDPITGIALGSVNLERFGPAIHAVVNSAISRAYSRAIAKPKKRLRRGKK